MPPQARFNDLCAGICYAHPIPISAIGYIKMGSATVLTDSKLTARKGDIVLTGCNHVGVIVGGSSQCLTDGMPNARKGDSINGSFVAQITLGSPKRIVG